MAEPVEKKPEPQTEVVRTPEAPLPEPVWVTSPSIPRLPMQDSAIALLQGKPGAAWCVAKDVVENSAVLALAFGLTGQKESIWRNAVLGALMFEAVVIAYTAAGMRVGKNGNPNPNKLSMI